MEDLLNFSTIVTKSLQPVSSEDRYFEGYLTVEMKDKQGEITIVDELYKVLPIWMDRGAPISDTHSNRIIGKGINYAKTVYKADDGSEYPAIKITGKIYKNYELDNDIWEKIKSGEYKGLSFGGATRTNRTPMRMKDGSVAYALKELEHYEVAVCREPAVPLALITDYNPVAKAFADNSEERDGKLVIKCSKFGCYIDKKDTPCWEGYEQVGMKEKDGKQVPNCVPKNTVSKAEDVKDEITTHKTGENNRVEEDRTQMKKGDDDKEDEDDEKGKRLEQGVKVEMEHTDDERVAEKIARDHLAEDPKYYKKLESVMPKEKAEHDGKQVELNKPMRDTEGQKKFKVYVKDPSSGNIKIVRFGDPDMEIKRDDPERRASFRARHDCDNAKDITTPQYWSCKMWEEGTSVSEYTEKSTDDLIKAEYINKPFGGYTDFDACVAANKDKDDPKAYCGYIKHQVEKADLIFKKEEKKDEVELTEGGKKVFEEAKRYAGLEMYKSHEMKEETKHPLKEESEALIEGKVTPSREPEEGKPVGQKEFNKKIIQENKSFEAKIAEFKVKTLKLKSVLLTLGKT